VQRGFYFKFIELKYDASYEGDIDTSETKLVLANSEKDAIDFFKKDFSRIDWSNTCTTMGEITAIKIDFNKVNRKRIVGYYNK
jgi:hypothetical protein